jgi:hypothetical protein
MLFYPNPLKNNDDLNFILFEDAARAEITITERSGRTLFIREYLNIGKNEPVKIHLTGLAKGTYLLKGTFNKYSKTVKLEVF